MKFLFTIIVTVAVCLSAFAGANPVQQSAWTTNTAGNLPSISGTGGNTLTASSASFGQLNINMGSGTLNGSTVSVGNLSGNGSGITGINAANVSGTFTGNGGGLTNLPTTTNLVQFIHSNGTFTNTIGTWLDNLYTNLAQPGDVIKLSQGQYAISNTITAKSSTSFALDPLAVVTSYYTNVNETAAIAMTNNFSWSGGTAICYWTNRFQTFFSTELGATNIIVTGTTLICPTDGFMFRNTDGKTNSALIANNNFIVGWDALYSGGGAYSILDIKNNSFVNWANSFNSNGYNEVFNIQGTGSYFFQGNSVTVAPSSITNNFGVYFFGNTGNSIFKSFGNVWRLPAGGYHINGTGTIPYGSQEYCASNIVANDSSPLDSIGSIQSYGFQPVRLTNSTAIVTNLGSSETVLWSNSIPVIDLYNGNSQLIGQYYGTLTNNANGKRIRVYFWDAGTKTLLADSGSQNATGAWTANAIINNTSPNNYVMSYAASVSLGGVSASQSGTLSLNDYIDTVAITVTATAVNNGDISGTAETVNYIGGDNSYQPNFASATNTISLLTTNGNGSGLTNLAAGSLVGTLPSILTNSISPGFTITNMSATGVGLGNPFIFQTNGILIVSGGITSYKFFATVFSDPTGSSGLTIPNIGIPTRLTGSSGIMASNFWSINTITATNGYFIPSNSIVASPIGGGGLLWNSNNALYWITSAHTNYVTGP